jgi:hypothetical protein
MEKFDLPGCSSKQKNQWEWRYYADRVIFLEKVQVFAFLVSKHSSESVNRNDVYL